MQSKILPLSLCLLIAVASKAEASEVIRGEAMAEEGEIVTKTKLAFAFIPHAEIENGYFVIDGGNIGDVGDTGIAAGLTIGKNNLYTDFYTRQSFSSDAFEMKNYGINLAYVISGKNNRETGYFGLALEQQNIKIDEGENHWHSQEVRVKPSLGVAFTEKTSPHYFSAGGGLIVGFGDVDIDQVAYKKSGVNGVQKIQYKGNDNYTTLGVFVQMKYGYNLSDNLTLLASIVAEENCSIDDPVVDNETFFSSGFMLYTRAGLQYRF